MRPKLLLLYILVNLALLSIPPCFANPCDKYAQQIRKLEDFRRQGGRASSMNRWAAKLDQLEQERFHCLNDPNRNPKIQTVSGASTHARNNNHLRDKNQQIESVKIPLSNLEKPKRSLSECIKPNRLIDREVNECMQGLKEPSWQ